jgi:hypothetical protein
MARRRNAVLAALVATLAFASSGASAQSASEQLPPPTVVRKVRRVVVPAGTPMPAGYRVVSSTPVSASAAPLANVAMAAPQQQPQFAAAAAAAPLAAPTAAASAEPEKARYSWQNMLKINPNAGGGNLLTSVASLAKTGINPNAPLNVEDLIKLGMSLPKLGNGTASLGDQMGAVAVANKVRRLLPKQGEAINAEFAAGVLDSITRDSSGKLDVTKLAKLAQAWAQALVPFAEQFARDVQTNANGVIASMLTNGSKMVDVQKIGTALGVKAESQQELLKALAPLLDKSSSQELYGLLQKLAKPGMEALQKSGAAGAGGDADVAQLMSTAMGALGRGVQKMG